MKTFLESVKEKDDTHKPVVMTYGRMNPPTTGHLKLIDKVRSTAEKLKAPHVVITSHSQDSKKNPLTDDQKIHHIKKYSPGVNVTSSDKEHPSFLHQAAKLHQAGHDHLHMVVGSDRVKEIHDTLHKYNGTHEGALYNFKKITVHNAGQRDPDAEGTEGMSGTKMREHAKNNDIDSFKKGVPDHVSGHHAKALMKDVRKGMGINEQFNRGSHKAIFVVGGPGSGKDLIIREAIAESKIVEHNYTQILSILGDKQNLSIKSKNLRMESIRNHQPIIINGSATDLDTISYIKEELEELGYETMMVFVETTNEFSQQRNSTLKRMVAESVRHDKWMNSLKNVDTFYEMFDNYITFNNSENLDLIEEGIDDVYKNTTLFLEQSIAKSVSKLILPKSKKLLFDTDKYPGKRIRTPGVGPELELRGSGTVYPMSGMGNPTYSEQKDFKNFRNKFKEDVNDNENEMGVSGGCSGASNKEPLVTPMDRFGTSGLTIKKKKVK
jgi:cytidyltransferase-like protein